MRSTIQRYFVLPLGAALLLTFGGCDDPQARKETAEAVKDLNVLRADVATMKTQNEALNKEIAALKAAIAQESEKRASMIEDKVAAAAQALNDQTALATKIVSDARQSLDSLSKSLQESMNEKMAKNDVALHTRQLDEKLAQATDDLKKYMDNQLRELYPYAYQPKRMDPNTPPPAEGAVPKKAPEAQ